jgi:hypothetical protein
MMRHDQQSTKLFFYTVRSTTIFSIISFLCAKKQNDLQETLIQLLQTLFRSSGVRFCFEYFCLQNLVRDRNVVVKSLPLGTQTGDLVPPTRVCYFYDHAHVDFVDGTLYVPVTSNYIATDAIGKCTVKFGTKSSSVLVYFQVSTSSTHPLETRANAAKAPLARATAMVNSWNGKSSAVDFSAVVFITSSEEFTDIEGDYVKVGLKKQYVYQTRPHRY